MKKILLLTLFGAVSVSQLMAVDLYVTGSTAFRKQVFPACQKLFTNGAPATTVFDLSGAIGGDGTSANSNPVWTMDGTCGPAVGVLAGTPLTIHANFTGSVQGMDNVENKIKIVFLTKSGSANTYMTNTPTIAFSDVASGSTPFPAAGNFSEEQVAVQPFVIVKSISTAPLMNSITNITYEQLKYLYSAGNMPLTSWTGNPNDYNTNIYLLNRTRDSGTRRTLFAYLGAGYAAGITTYNYDVTNHTFYLASGTTLGLVGGTGCGVIGGFAGYNNANLAFLQGYIGGPDIQAAMKVNDAQNLSLSYLSFGDAQKLVSSSYWSQVLPLNGVWPTAAGPGVRGNQTGTNDFTPICKGAYGYWSYEVVVYPTVDPSSLSSDQNLTAAQLGSGTTANTILGVLDNVTSATPIPGSLDNEIQASKTGSPGATAIRLIDMTSSRSAVGGVISP
jgi:hypothetical protein